MSKPTETADQAPGGRSPGPASGPIFYKEQIEGLIAQAEVDVDLFRYEVESLLEWVKAYANFRLAELELEDLGDG